jgi:phenylalanyl-tRNA synthetase beta chain
MPQRVLFAEINLHDLIQVRAQAAKMQDLPLYPGSERDLTLTINDQMPIAEVFAAIRQSPSGLLEDVSLIDVYRSDKLGKDIKNVTFRFIYRDREKTLSQEKVDAEHQRIVDTIVKSIPQLKIG